MIYTDAKAKYVMVGSVYEVEGKVNLTEQRLRKLNRVDIASLPLDLAFKRVKGNGERKLIVFSDADCPFCAKLENELKRSTTSRSTRSCSRSTSCTRTRRASRG